MTDAAFGSRVLTPRCTDKPARARTSRTAELSPETLAITVNGQLMLAMDRHLSVGKVQPLQQPFQLVLNLALGGAWAGPIDAAALPATMTIKSIRMWEWQPWIGPDAAARLEECCKSLLR
jgi:hypothetical protein